MNPMMARSKKRTAPTAPTIMPAFNSAWKSVPRMLAWHFSLGRKIRRSSEELPKKVWLGFERLLVPAQILITYSWLPCNSLIRNWKKQKTKVQQPYLTWRKSRSINYSYSLVGLCRIILNGNIIKSFSAVGLVIQLIIVHRSVKSEKKKNKLGLLKRTFMQKISICSFLRFYACKKSWKTLRFPLATQSATAFSQEIRKWFFC